MYKKIFLVSCLSIFISCSDFLDVGLPNDQLTKDLVFKDDNLAKSTMAGIYRSLDEDGFLSGSTSGGGIYLGCFADELLSYQLASANLSLLSNLNINAQTTVIKTLWQTTYSQLYNINAVIEGLSRSTQIQNSLKNQLMGEAYFLRAMLHLYLTQVYNRVPYVLSIDYNINQSINSLPQDKILEFARRDADLALQLLPDDMAKGNKIRPTKVSTSALLARIALLQKDWLAAAYYASMIIENPNYKLENDIKKVFLKEGSSIIWSFQSVTGQSNTKEALTYLLSSAPPSVVSLNPLLIQSFENTDQRLSNWIGTIKDAQNRTYYFANKYKQKSTTTTSQEYSVIFRAEEQYLIRAEAYAQQGILDKAAIDIDVIRKRAGLQNIPLLNREGLLSAISSERRHEFFTEYGHRFMDLKRMGYLTSEMMIAKPQWKSKFSYFPIPESEIILNPNLGPQNDGY